MNEEIAASFKRPLLLYDAACPMCLSIISGLHFFGFAQAVQMLSWQDAVRQDAALEQSELAERVRREIVLVFPETRQTLGGVAVLPWLLQRREITQWLGNLLQKPKILAIGQWVYETVALNRRILTPPKQPELACACDPPETARLRLRLYCGLLLVSLAGLIAFSCALAVTYEMRAINIILNLLRAMSGGWLLAYTGLLLLLRRRFFEYFQQSLVVMAVGGLWLLFAAVLLIMVNGAFQDTFPKLASLISILSLNLHTAVMWLSTLRRSADLHFPASLPWLWLVLYFGGYLLLFQGF
jgi:predicted DCC family thiol-disulfide oxidoreductase YuxK